jgi:hypothetical protein
MDELILWKRPRSTAIRKLAAEAAEKGFLASELAAGISRVKRGVLLVISEIKKLADAN